MWGDGLKAVGPREQRQADLTFLSLSQHSYGERENDEEKKLDRRKEIKEKEGGIRQRMHVGMYEYMHQR